MYEKWMLAAQQNIEAHIGDVCSCDDEPSHIAEETYNLAFDGAVDAGADHATARTIANQVTGS